MIDRWRPPGSHHRERAHRYDRRSPTRGSCVGCAVNGTLPVRGACRARRIVVSFGCCDLPRSPSHSLFQYLRPHHKIDPCGSGSIVFRHHHEHPCRTAMRRRASVACTPFGRSRRATEFLDTDRRSRRGRGERLRSESVRWVCGARRLAPVHLTGLRREAAGTPGRGATKRTTPHAITQGLERRHPTGPDIRSDHEAGGSFPACVRIRCADDGGAR